MKRFLLIATLFSVTAHAQYVTDAFRFSEIKQTGTARMRALGGSHTALGGDASNLFSNPAGLGFYNRSEISITPIVTLLGNDANYINNTISNNQTGFGIGNASLIFRMSESNRSKWKRKAWGFGYAKQIDLNSQFGYKGTNQKSSIADYFVEAANRDGASAATLDSEFNPNSGTAQTPAAAFYQSYLIDGSTQNGPPYVRYDKNYPTDQTGNFNSTGSTSTFNISYGANYQDKLYVGAAVGFTSIKYNYQHNLSEKFTKGKVFNGVGYNEKLAVNGSGINLSLGMIYKLAENLQVGANFITPTVYEVSETFTERVNTSLIDRKIINPDFTEISVQPQDFVYNLNSPARLSGGAVLFLGKKKGFISADVEYVNYTGMRVTDPEDATFGSANKQQIQSTYKDGINYKIGAEVRTGNIRLRGGANVLGNVYQTSSSKEGNKILLSGGIGIRNGEYYLDATGVYGTYFNSFTPYKLNNPADYASVGIDNRQFNLAISVGRFF